MTFDRTLTLGTMVVILDGNSEHVAPSWRKTDHFWDKENPICDCSRSNQLPSTGQITETSPYVRTHFRVAI